MLVCHCNIITEDEIEQAIEDLLDEDPWQLIVPAKLYHTLGKRGRCCGCFPSVIDIIIRVTERRHSAMAEVTGSGTRWSAILTACGTG
jgi:bacterioferritin-associated ferredoxin